MLRPSSFAVALGLALAAVGSACSRVDATARSQRALAAMSREAARPAAAVAPVNAAVPATAGRGTDRGVFPDLDGKLKLELPRWLVAGPLDVWRTADASEAFVLAAGVPVAFAASDAQATVEGRGLGQHDADADGVPDALDILLGAKKVALNGAEYRSTYRVLDYPDGDVPRSEGVCTDVVVRALRNAGFDLQRLVHEDLRASPGRYPSVEKPNRNIDHRRVRVLLPWFVSHWTALPVDAEASAEPHLPGDLVFFDTLRGPEPDHLGIVSDEVGPSGLPLVINNWTDGYRESAMDLLPSIPVTHRFRVPSARLRTNQREAGLPGLLARRGLEIDGASRQLLLVTAPLWSHSAGTLRRFERASPEAAWRAVGAPIAVRLGARGLGRGRGLHAASTALPGLDAKREGDGRGPAGVFALGAAFGPGARAPGEAVRWPWRQARPGDVYVDDPASPDYNQWRRAPADESGARWRSAEDLTDYELGVIVEHNPVPVEPKAGSAIFLHTTDMKRATRGCTAMPEKDLRALLAWLSPSARPVLAQVAGELYESAEP